ncbi:MAG: type II toxin-antitoxin system RelE/ParE family toxin [Woeseiaceae bacterium]
MRVQFRLPVGMPLCRAMGNGLWEVRTDLPSQRIARLLFHLHDGKLVVVHAMIKKTHKTPLADLSLARKRMKEVAK